ncbi:MAG: TAXI family TRAP transporter solute-binding subunit [Hyphomicrobiaceae bacterium]
MIDRRKTIALAAGAAVAPLLGRTALAQSRPEVNISLLGAPFGTGTYILSSGHEQISKKHHPWLRISAAESPGYVFNMRKLDEDRALRKTTIIGSGPALMRLGEDGAKPFDKKIERPKVIANFVITAVWLTSLDAKLTEPAQVAGKRIGFGTAAQINWSVLPRAVIEHGWGIPLSNVKLQYLGNKQAVTALLDGKVDLAISGGYVDPGSKAIALAPPTTELIATGRELHHISWGTAAVEKTAPKGFEITPYTVPAKTVDGKNADIQTFIDSGAWTAYPELPDEIAYETTKLIISHLAVFGETHAVGKLMSQKALVFGWKPEHFHPGALKAYKEAGILG